MTLQQMRYIATIADTGSINKASELLYVSQPSLTAAIQEVEREVGFAVFHRGGRGVTPTADGQELIVYARQAYVYISRSHPLAGESAISMAQLADYPCLSFEQGAGASFYFAEEILTTREYPRTIHTTDRATNLNLMIALNAYTLCSGVISEELNGPEYVAVPFLSDDENQNSVMEIGYITRKNALLTEPGQRYVEEIQRYLHAHAERTE